MEFKSQQCTSVEQSKRLLELGLKKETADMMYITSDVDGLGKPLPEEYRYHRLEIGDYHKPIGKGMLHIPAWSLSRLIEIMPFNVGKYSEFGLFLSKNTLEIMDVEEGTTDTFWDSEDVYENVIASIEWLIKEGYFNKDYLEETK